MGRKREREKENMGRSFIVHTISVRDKATIRKAKHMVKNENQSPERCIFSKKRERKRKRKKEIKRKKEKKEKDKKKGRVQVETFCFHFFCEFISC